MLRVKATATNQRLTAEVRFSKEWLYEVKCDGYRCLAGKRKGNVIGKAPSGSSLIFAVCKSPASSYSTPAKEFSDVKGRQQTLGLSLRAVFSSYAVSAKGRFTNFEETDSYQRRNCSPIYFYQRMSFQSGCYLRQMNARKANTTRLWTYFPS